MPPKIKGLIAELERAGFTNRGGKRSHRNFYHPELRCPLTLFGKLGDDAKKYQVRAVRQTVREVLK
jgi:predicted RNA binding protein YcfA (HicA-like mRNA interferase family)